MLRKLRPWLKPASAIALDALFALICGAMLLRLALLLGSPPLAASNAAAAPSAGTASASDRNAALLAAAPFGQANADPASASRPPETLILAGVMLAERGDDSRAILRLESGEQRAFGVGDALADGRRVLRVEASAVTLAGAAGEVTIPLHPRAGDSAAAAPAAKASAAAEVAPAAPRGLVIDKRSHASAREFLSKLRSDAGRDPSVLAKLINIEPETGADGSGFRIYGRNQEALLARAGLESGDLVTEVNGVQLDDPLAGLAAAEQLANADELTVKLIRNGSPITVKLRLGEPTP